MENNDRSGREDNSIHTMIQVFLLNRVNSENALDPWENRYSGDVNSSPVFQWSVNISVNVTASSGHVTINNWWALLALALVLGTAAGNILVCLAITWERRLQNVTNYFLMSLAITDLMVAVLVMPLGILTLVRGKWSLTSSLISLSLGLYASKVIFETIGNLC